MKKLLFVVTVLLSGCSVLNPLITSDLTQATTMATTAGDTQGLTCLKGFQPVFSGSVVGGFFTGLEQYRLFQSAMSNCFGIVPLPVPK